MTTTTQAPSPSAYQPIDGRLLDVENLHVHFHTADGVAKAINGVSFHLDQGESLAILGESGSGKSVTAQAIMGILDMPPARIPEGVIRYCGQDLLTMPEEQRRKTRGPEISMIFQDALSSLNPVFPVGWQIAEMFREHRGMNKSDALAQAVRLMERVQIPASHCRTCSPAKARSRRAAFLRCRSAARADARAEIVAASSLMVALVTKSSGPRGGSRRGPRW